MIVTVPYRKVRGEIKLVITVDALTDENGEVIYTPIYNKKGEEIRKMPVLRGFYIRQNETGIEYSQAIDTVPCKYTYSETDREIE